MDTVCPVAEKEGLPVDQVFLGTCTGGRYEDLAAFAALVRGKQVAVRTVVVPASRADLIQGVSTGVLATSSPPGATWRLPAAALTSGYIRTVPTKAPY